MAIIFSKERAAPTAVDPSALMDSKTDVEAKPVNESSTQGPCCRDKCANGKGCCKAKCACCFLVAAPIVVPVMIVLSPFILVRRAIRCAISRPG